MAVWGGLTNSCEKKRSEKQGKKERYKHPNAEFQRIARRDTYIYIDCYIKTSREPQVKNQQQIHTQERKSYSNTTLR